MLLVGAAWVRGQRPGPGTVVQPVVTGLAVSATLECSGTPDSLSGRAVLLGVAFALLAIGVAGYLGSATGAGPAEAAAVAWDPPVPFRWSYSLLQGGGAVVGWLLGVDVGAGTILVVLGLGPAVDVLLVRVPGGRRTPAAKSTGG